MYRNVGIKPISVHARNDDSLKISDLLECTSDYISTNKLKKEEVKVLHPIILTADFLLAKTHEKQHDQKPGLPSHKWQLIKLDLDCVWNETIIFQKIIGFFS